MTSKTLPTVSVVIEGSTDPSGHLVRHAIEAIDRQTYPRDLIDIVVMDASGDGHVGELVASTWPQAKVVPAGHLSYYDMKNVGARRGTGQLVAFIDSDVTWNETWLHEACETLEELPPYSAVVGLTQYAPGWFSQVGTVSQFGHHWHRYASKRPDKLLGVIANNFAMRRSEFLDIEYRFTNYRQGMDMVLASDCQGRGGEVRLNPAMRATHKWGTSKLWEHPQTAWNVGRGLMTALRHCDDFWRDGAFTRDLAALRLPGAPAWVRKGRSPIVALGAVTVRLAAFYRYYFGSRHVLGIRWYQVPAHSVFLTGFFAVIAAGAVVSGKPAA
jgi:hypothetical protein